MKITLGFLIILASLFNSCSSKKVAKQLELVEQISSEELEVRKYANRSLLKFVAGRQENGILKGRIIEFDEQGNLERMFFRNDVGAKVGDESYFEGNKLQEHVFRKDKWTVLFYASFDNNEKVDSVDGKPYLVHYKNNINQGDTAEFYIATPIIPHHKTMVQFGDESVPETVVEYENDLRQYTYLFIPSWNQKKYNFKLRVNILDSLGQVRVSDSTEIELKVNLL